MGINVTRSSMPPFSEYCNEIKDIWESHWLTNMGAKHKALEMALKNYLGCSHITLFVNGHLALENAIAAFNFPKGSEIITTPFTFASTTHAIIRNGLTPVFCDINPNDYTIDVSLVEKLISRKTVAILPVHVYGNVCDVENIKKIADSYSLKVIYDSAHAFGVKYKGISIANYGDASMFSFHATKVFHTIEGGAVCFSDDTLKPILDYSKDFGIKNEETYVFVGGNAKMNEFQAAMGLCNLRHLDAEIQKRKKIVFLYRKLLGSQSGIKVNEDKEKTESNYAYFPVCFFDYRYDRNTIKKMLMGRNIFSRKYFFPLTSDFECYKNYPTCGGSKTPVAKDISDHVLALPLYSDLTAEEVSLICEIIMG